jgi:hypothetical protein
MVGKAGNTELRKRRLNGDATPKCENAATKAAF